MVIYWLELGLDLRAAKEVALMIQQVVQSSVLLCII